MEVDMNNNVGITYICLNFNMTIKNFTRHIQIEIQAMGYIQIEIQAMRYRSFQIFLRKIMNDIHNNFKVQINGIIETLRSKGIQFLKPRQYNSEELARLEWTIKLDEQKTPLLQP